MNRSLPWRLVRYLSSLSSKQGCHSNRKIRAFIFSRQKIYFEYREIFEVLTIKEQFSFPSCTRYIVMSLNFALVYFRRGWGTVQRDEEDGDGGQEESKNCTSTEVLQCHCYNVTSSVKYSMTSLKARLRRASESMLRQLCDDTNDSVLIDNNGVPPDWDCDSTIFNENNIASAIAEFLQQWCRCLM